LIGVSTLCFVVFQGKDIAKVSPSDKAGTDRQQWLNWLTKYRARLAAEVRQGRILALREFGLLILGV